MECNCPCFVCDPTSSSSEEPPPPRDRSRSRTPVPELDRATSPSRGADANPEPETNSTEVVENCRRSHFSFPDSHSHTNCPDTSREHCSSCFMQNKHMCLACKSIAIHPNTSTACTCHSIRCPACDVCQDNSIEISCASACSCQHSAYLSSMLNSEAGLDQQERNMQHTIRHLHENPHNTSTLKDNQSTHTSFTHTLKDNQSTHPSHTRTHHTHHQSTSHT